MLRRWLSPHEVDQQIVLVIYSAVEDRCGSLLAVAVVWSLVLVKGGRTVVFQFLETFVAGLLDCGFHLLKFLLGKMLW